MSTFTGSITAETIPPALIAFLDNHTRQPVTTDLDLFGSGLVTSLFALELLVHLESTFGVTVGPDDLRLDNFRTVEAMTALVLRLAGGTDA